MSTVAGNDPTAAIARPQVCDLTAMLGQAAHVVNMLLAAELAVIDSTPRAHCVLRHALEEERTQTRLAALADLDKTTMVVLMDDLERRGLAVRRPSAVDRRARIVVVSAAGAELVARGTEIVDRVHREVLDTLGPDQDAFVRSLTALVDGRLAVVERGPGAPRRARESRPQARRGRG